jgi:hypothetical protein
MNCEIPQLFMREAAIGCLFYIWCMKKPARSGLDQIICLWWAAEAGISKAHVKTVNFYYGSVKVK